MTLHHQGTGSMIQEMSYEAADETLTVTFANGGRYEYLGVPMTVWTELTTAPSLGSAFTSLVKRGGFAYNKL